MKWISKHFRRYRQREPWGFCWRIAIEGTIVALAIAFILSFFDLPEREIPFGFWPFLIIGVVVAPILETFVFQAFPVWIARLCKARFSVQVIVSVVPFFLAHVIEGIQTGIAAGLISGFYLAFTYVHWRKKRRWTAFWVTAVSHAIHNAIVISLALALGEI
jgi:hypothetical protein